MTTRLPPPDFTDSDEHVMSNFDGSIDPALAEKLRQQKLVMGYSGHAFHGEVWFSEEQFHCLIRVFGIAKETVSKQSLREIMEEVSAEYGAE